MIPTTAPVKPPTNERPADEILGANILICGPPGTGKTTSLKTILLNNPWPLEVFAIFTEPRYDVLGREFLDKIHWKYIPPATVGWGALVTAAKQVNTMSNDSLQKITSPDRLQYTQFIQVLEQCNDFEDQHGQHFGDVSSWGTNRVLVLDGLTGLSKMARLLGVGSKPILSQPDWGVAMNTISGFIDKITTDKRCHFVLITHLEREVDEVSGGIKNMVSTLGRKLAPVIPVNFSDVILAVREGANFFWDTASTNVDLKPGNLPIHAKQTPDFKSIFKGWVAKGGVFQD